MAKKMSAVVEHSTEYVDSSTVIKRVTVRIMLFLLVITSVAYGASSFFYDSRKNLEQDLRDLEIDIQTSRNIIEVENSRLEIWTMRSKAKRCDLASIKLEAEEEITAETRALCFP